MANPLNVAMAVAALTGLAASACADGSDGTNRVQVMAASSMVDLLGSLPATAAEGSSLPDFVVDYAGSSSLVVQLRAGAAADVLITANRETMDATIADGSVRGDPIVFATNTLVVALAPGNPGDIRSLDDLIDPRRLVGVCAVEVPCGAAAMRAISALGVELRPDTFEANVRSLATKVKLGELDAGLIYVTDADSLGLQIMADVGPLPDSLIEYLVVSIEVEPGAETDAFIEALVSGRAARQLISDSGFGLP